MTEWAKPFATIASWQATPVVLERWMTSGRRSRWIRRVLRTHSVTSWRHFRYGSFIGR